MISGYSNRGILLMDYNRGVWSWFLRHFLGLFWSRFASCATPSTARSLRRAPQPTRVMNWYRLCDLWLSNCRLGLIIEHLLRCFALRWIIFLWCHRRSCSFLLRYDPLCFSFLGADRFALARRLGVTGWISVIWLLSRCNRCRLLGGLRGGLFRIGFHSSRCRSRWVVGISTAIWVFVRSARLLLITLPSVHSESKALTTSLIIGSGLWHLLLEIEVGVVVLVLNAGWCWRTRLYDNWIYVLNLGDFNLLLSILSWRAAPSHGLRWVRAVATATTAHQSRVVSELEALVSFARADWGIVVRPNLTTCEALLELWRAIQGRITALNLLLGLRVLIGYAMTNSSLAHRLRVRGHRVAHLRCCWLLGGSACILGLDRQVPLLSSRLHTFRCTCR